MTGVSKSYAMTGWRVGFCAGPAPLIKAMTVAQATATSGVSTIGQAAAAAALDGPQDYLAVRAATYQSRRDLVVAALNEIPGMSCHTPNGAFYVFPDISAWIGKTSKAGSKHHQRRSLRHGPPQRSPCRHRPGRRLRHEPPYPHQHRHLKGTSEPGQYPHR